MAWGTIAIDSSEVTAATRQRGHQKCVLGLWGGTTKLNMEEDSAEAKRTGPTRVMGYRSELVCRWSGWGGGVGGGEVEG